MDEKIRWCMLIIICMVVGLIYLYKVLKKKMLFRDWITGTLIYVIAKVFLYQIMYSLLLSLLGPEISPTIRTTILCGLDAIVTVLIYVLIHKMFYSRSSTSITAFSLGFGEGCIEVLSTCTYALLSYALMMNAVSNGTVTDVLLNQGFTTELIPSAIEYINDFSTMSMILITLQAVTIIACQLIVSCLVYRRIENNNNKLLVYAFGLILAFNLTNNVIAGINNIVGLIIIIILLFGCYYYVFCVKDNEILLTYNEKDFVEHKKTKRYKQKRKQRVGEGV